MDDCKYLKASYIITLRDQWMINNNKINPNLKT